MAMKEKLQPQANNIACILTAAVLCLAAFALGVESSNNVNNPHFQPFVGVEGESACNRVSTDYDVSLYTFMLTQRIPLNLFDETSLYYHKVTPEEAMTLWIIIHKELEEFPLDPLVKRELAGARDALCFYYLRELPASTLDVKLLADLTLMDHHIDFTAAIIYLTPHSDPNAVDFLQEGFPNMYGMFLLSEIAHITLKNLNHAVLPDNALVERLGLILRELLKLTAGPYILEVCSGWGLLAEGLRESNFKIIATDTLDPAYFKQGREALAHNVAQFDILDALETFVFASTVIAFFPMNSDQNRFIPSLMTGRTRGAYLYVDRQPIYKKTGTDSRIRVNSQLLRRVYFETLDIAVPTAFGPLPAYLMFWDRDDADQQNWLNDIKQIKKAKFSAEKLLRQQQRQYPVKTRTGIIPASEADKKQDREQKQRKTEL